MPALLQEEGLVLEEIDADLCALTIDLKKVIPAEVLATLLSGLAGFYRSGASLDDPNHDPWVWIGKGNNGETESSRELLITELIIGSPNKLKVVGRKRWIKNLNKVLSALIALSQLTGGGVDRGHGGEGVAPQASQTSYNSQNVNVNLPTQPASSGSSEGHASLADINDAIRADIEALNDLDAQLSAGKISLGDYQWRRTMLETAVRDLVAGMPIIRRPG